MNTQDNQNNEPTVEPTDIQTENNQSSGASEASSPAPTAAGGGDIDRETEIAKLPVLDDTDFEGDEEDRNDFFKNFEGSDDVEFDDAGDEKELPLFDFAVAPFVTLPDGTEFQFKIPDLQSELRADQLRKTTIITSPAKVNGQNPTQETTDYAKADIRYFLDNIQTIKGMVLVRGDDPDQVLDAKQVVREETIKGKARRITIAHLVPKKWARAAVSRVYGGKIEVKKKEKSEDRIVVLTENRRIIVRQEMGVEQNDDGTFTKPTHVLEYVFIEPETGHLTKWQTKCFGGFKVPIKGGGSHEERYFNTEQVAELFDSMIDNVTGGAWNGAPLHVKNTEHLAGIPVGVKRVAITLAMGDATGDVPKK